ncbi:helix-turn-helix domain-containing protein [Methylobacterium sp. WL6]|uniref:helix-turn-helix domain-containing protein n=1 Tax=Methylobacterium sp. WL6 TaxID=2603901 RepID=UPI0011CB6BAE|nr:helix-turn-helix domain-containing protein [Methylobacterium sp. WL6]TXN71623.1 transcriptional regulator [Methylobacterium sp. WL6]
MSDADSRTPVEEGWHQQDILAAIRKKGATVSSLNRDNGFRPGVLRTVFYKRWPGGQRIIADFLQVPVEELWPHWYGPGGTLKPLQGATRGRAA